MWSRHFVCTVYSARNVDEAGLNLANFSLLVLVQNIVFFLERVLGCAESQSSRICPLKSVILCF